MDNIGDQGRIDAELIDQLHKQSPIGMVATLVNSAILVFILWNLVVHHVLLLWLVVSAAVTVLRYGLISGYRTAASRKIQRQWLGMMHVVGFAVSGLVWGSAGLFLFPAESTAHQAFIAFVLAGMVAGAVGTCSSVFAAFVAFSLPALVPIFIRFLLIGDDLHMAMGAMTLLFLILTSLTAWRINVAATEPVALKEHFAEKVIERTNELIQANEELNREILDRKHAEAQIRLALREKEVLLKEIHHRVKNNLAVIIEAEDVHLPIDAAMPCGLILNELLTNAFKHAFTHRDGGQILIAAQISDGGVFELSFRDNGVGLPAGLDLEKCSSLGFRIISVLVKHQMEGSWEARNENGAVIRIRWPIQTKEGRYDRMPV